jgi:DNA-binding beta-propeller fold protein YncE
MRRLVVLGLVGALAFSFVGSPASRAATVFASWPVRQQPFGLAIDEQTGKVYVANSGTVMFDLRDPSAAHGVVSVVDPATGSIGRILTSQTANSVLVDAAARRLYSSNEALDGSGRSVDVFDIDSGGLITSIPVGGHGMALDPAAGRLYVCEGTSLRVIDTTTFAVVDIAPAPASAVWFGVAVDPDRHQLYVTNLREASPSFFILDDGDLTMREIQFPTATRSALVVDPVSHLVFTAGGEWNGQAFASTLSVVDPDTRQIVHTTSLPGFALGIALAPSRHRIYVSDNDGRRLYGIDDSTFELAETISLPFLPGELALHTDGRLIVGSYDSHSSADSTLEALDLANHAPIIRSTTLGPAAARPGDLITASVDAFDPDLRPMGVADPTTLSYEWFVNGSLVAGETGSRHRLEATGSGGRGYTVVVRVTASDGQERSTSTAMLAVPNTNPSVTVSLSNSSPKTNDVLTATATGTDVDGDTLTYTYTWQVNGLVRRTTTTSAATDRFDLKVKGNGDKGDLVTVSVTASDTAATSTATTSATVR